MTPSAAQIRAQLEAVLQLAPSAAAVAIRAERRAEWPPQVEAGQRRFSLQWCDSPLAARLALRQARADDGGDGVALLTPLPDAQLGADVLARLAGRRVFSIRPWEVVRQAFRAREDIDARLARHGWMAELLVESMPPEGYPPAPSGVLDTDTAWRWTLRAACGLDAARPDPETLLRWTLEGDGPQRLLALSDRPRTGIAEWLTECGGAAGRLIVAAIGAGFARDATPLGVVLDLLTGEAAAEPDVAAAAVRFERFVGGQRVEPAAARRWADAALRVLRGLDEAQAKAVLERADALAAELYLRPHVAASDWLPSGFEARLGRFAAALARFAAHPDTDHLQPLEAALQGVRAHQSRVALPARLERAEMALRLARWLVTAEAGAAGFEGLALAYAEGDAFADWARVCLVGGDVSAELSRAYSALAAQAATRREQGNRAFAEALKHWNETGTCSAALPGVEEILPRVVARMAQHAPVLLLVVDGLSLPVLAELEPELARLGWIAVQPNGEPWAGIAVAALPTVTEVSRASLLAGRIVSGGQAQERAAFAAFEGFAAVSRQGAPVLFHKGDLLGGDGLAAAVREAVGSMRQRVVGVVYNAIDDQLDGADQLHLRWTLNDLRLLPALLHEARGAGRVVVLTADHGHVPELGTEQRAGSGADRWRIPDGQLGPGEIRIEGGRVLTPMGGRAITAAWSERIRYGAKKNGYHGGVSPTEALVPLRVLVPGGVALPGWQPCVQQRPTWWFDGGAHIPPPRAAAPPQRQTPAGPEEHQPSLFGPEVTAPPEEGPDIVDALLASAVYQAQKKLAARVAPDDAQIRTLLLALRERGGKLSIAAAAQRLGLPAFRMSGFLSAVRRVLNVDRSEVLRVDQTSSMIELNEALLAVQFQLGRS